MKTMKNNVSEDKQIPRRQKKSTMENSLSAKTFLNNPGQMAGENLY